jgi:peptidoglycan/LPS O-acetylase OafA/YrhL
VDVLSRQHLPALDGIRGVAILLVMLLHFELYVWPFHHGLGAPVWLLIREGWVGVDLFFVLSGFLITGILLDAKGKPGYFTVFYARRSLRIFPAYYVALLVIIWVVPSFFAFRGAHPGGGIIWCWLYLANIGIAWGGWEAIPQAANHFWSLAIEEQFYLVWPLIVHRASQRQIARLASAAIVVSLMLRVVLRALGASAEVGYVLTPARLDALAMGALVAAILRQAGGADRLRRWAAPVALASGTASIVLIGLRPGGSYQDAIIGTIGFTTIALFFASLIAASVTSPSHSWFVRPWEVGWLRSLGRYSYGLYIYHFIVAGALGRTHLLAALDARTAPLVAQLAYFAVALGASMACALLSWHVVEQPMLRMKRKFRYECHPPFRRRVVSSVVGV